MCPQFAFIQSYKSSPYFYTIIWTSILLFYGRMPPPSFFQSYESHAHLTSRGRIRITLHIKFWWWRIRETCLKPNSWCCLQVHVLVGRAAFNQGGGYCCRPASGFSAPPVLTVVLLTLLPEVGMNNDENCDNYEDTEPRKTQSAVRTLQSVRPWISVYTSGQLLICRTDLLPPSQPPSA